MTAPSALPYPGSGRAWTTVAVLVLATVLSVLDRNILALFVDDVRGDLHVTDVQVSLLQGLSFSLVYSASGLVLGALADRTTRKWLLFAGLCCWSGAVGVSGYATSFGALFASRVLVGLGEATLAPVAVSMISDLFAPANRGRPLSVYMTAQAIAPGVSIFLLGYLSKHSRDGSLALIPGAAWRSAFAFCGLLGVVAAAFVVGMHEPTRRGVAIGRSAGLGLGTSFGYLRRHGRFFAAFYGAFALSTVGAYALGSWSPTVLMRLYGLPPDEIGRLLGGISIGAGLVGGLLADAIAKRVRPGDLGAKLKALVVTSIALAPGGLGALAPTAFFAILLFSLMSAGLPILGALTIATAQEAVPSDMRGLATALFALAAVVGLTFGPLLVALLTQHLFGRPDAVGYSLMLVFSPALVLSGLVYGYAHVVQRRLLGQGAEISRVIARQ